MEPTSRACAAKTLVPSGVWRAPQSAPISRLFWPQRNPHSAFLPRSLRAPTEYCNPRPLVARLQPRHLAPTGLHLPSARTPMASPQRSSACTMSLGRPMFAPRKTALVATRHLPHGGHCSLRAECCANRLSVSHSSSASGGRVEQISWCKAQPCRTTCSHGCPFAAALANGRSWTLHRSSFLGCR